MNFNYSIIDTTLLNHELRLKKNLQKTSLNSPLLNSISRYTDKYRPKINTKIKFDSMIYDLLPNELQGAYVKEVVEVMESVSEEESGEEEEENDYNRNYGDEEGEEEEEEDGGDFE